MTVLKEFKKYRTETRMKRFQTQTKNQFEKWIRNIKVINVFDVRLINRIKRRTKVKFYKRTGVKMFIKNNYSDVQNVSKNPSPTILIVSCQTVVNLSVKLGLCCWNEFLRSTIFWQAFYSIFCVSNFWWV